MRSQDKFLKMGGVGVGVGVLSVFAVGVFVVCLSSAQPHAETLCGCFGFRFRSLGFFRIVGRIWRSVTVYVLRVLPLAVMTCNPKSAGALPRK